MSIKQKTTKPLGFPVVFCRLSDRKDIWLIKIPVVVPVSFSFMRALAHPCVPGKRSVKRHVYYRFTSISSFHTKLHTDSASTYFAECTLQVITLPLHTMRI